MKYINAEKINNLLADAFKVDSRKLDVILGKAKSLQRLTLEESAALLSVKDPEYIQRIFDEKSKNISKFLDIIADSASKMYKEEAKAYNAES